MGRSRLRYSAFRLYCRSHSTIVYWALICVQFYARLPGALFVPRSRESAKAILLRGRQLLRLIFRPLTKTTRNMWGKVQCAG